MSIVHQSASCGTASSTSSDSVCCRSSVWLRTTLACARKASASSRWRCSVRSKRVATAATISPPASRTGSALSETMPREPSARTTSISLAVVDSSCQRQVHELGVRSCDRALRCAVSQQVLRALVREQQLARRGLGDDHAERQLPYERRQALALAVRLLVERAVVERERDAPRDLRGELPLILVGQVSPTATRRSARRAFARARAAASRAWCGSRRAPPRCDARRSGRRCPAGLRSRRRPAARRCGSRRRRACRS